FSCAYLHNLSWANATTPLRKQTSPKDVFDRLFAGGAPTPMTPAPGGPAPRPDPTALYDKSVLDLVANRAAALKQRLGRTDQQKLDQYFTTVREVEMRIARTTTPVDPMMPPPPPPSGCSAQPPANLTKATMTYQ